MCYRLWQRCRLTPVWRWPTFSLELTSTAQARGLTASYWRLLGDEPVLADCQLRWVVAVHCQSERLSFSTSKAFCSGASSCYYKGAVERLSIAQSRGQDRNEVEVLRHTTTCQVRPEPSLSCWKVCFSWGRHCVTPTNKQTKQKKKTTKTRLNAQLRAILIRNDITK